MRIRFLDTLLRLVAVMQAMSVGRMSRWKRQQKTVSSCVSDDFLF